MLLQNTTISIAVVMPPFTSSLQQWARCPEINRHEGAAEAVLYYNRHTKPLRAITPGECRNMAWAKKIECCRCSYALNNGTRPELYMVKDEGISFDEIHTRSKLNNKEKDKPTLNSFKNCIRNKDISSQLEGGCQNCGLCSTHSIFNGHQI